MEEGKYFVSKMKLGMSLVQQTFVMSIATLLHIVTTSLTNFSIMHLYMVFLNLH